MGLLLCVPSARSTFDGRIMRLWDTSAPPEELSAEEVKTVVSSLLAHAPSLVEGVNGPPSAKEDFLKLLVTNSAVLHLRQSRWGNEPLYSKGVPTNLCTVVLNGQFKVEDGTEAGPSTVLSTGAVTASEGSQYLPDQSVSLSSDTAKCLQVNQATFKATVRLYDPSNLDKSRAEIRALLLHRPHMLRKDSSRRLGSLSQPPLSPSTSTTSVAPPFGRTTTRKLSMSRTQLVTIISGAGPTPPGSPEE